MNLYIECKMGAAGDMLMAAGYELLEDGQKEKFVATMNGIFPGTIQVEAHPAEKCGIKGTHMEVLSLGQEEVPNLDSAHEHDHDGHAHQEGTPDEHHHAHHSYASVLLAIDGLSLPEDVKENAKAIYKRIGEAEASVHGCTLENIHFHEVGSIDAIADVIGSCLLIHMLAPEKIVVSPIHVGNGTVKCAHGILPVPAPATEQILRGVPYYTGEIMSELCTPTGAAILTHFATEFGPMPIANVQKVGCGMGHKDFAVANMVRIFAYEDATPASNRDVECMQAQRGSNSLPSGNQHRIIDGDQVCEISCNIDDMTGEDLGYAIDRLMEEGALDVFYSLVQMKKNRPGILLRVICKPKEQEKFAALLLKHTTTRGVRYTFYDRTKMTARFEEIESELGTVRLKVNEGLGITKSKLEYEDLKKIADATGKSIRDIRTILEGVLLER